MMSPFSIQVQKIDVTITSLSLLTSNGLTHQVVSKSRFVLFGFFIFSHTMYQSISVCLPIRL